MIYKFRENLSLSGDKDLSISFISRLILKSLVHVLQRQEHAITLVSVGLQGFQISYFCSQLKIQAQV